MNIAILKLKTTALFPIKVISIKEYSNDNLYRCTDTACRSMNITRVQASGSLDQTSVKFWGAWPAGVYIWEQSTNQWAKMPDTEGVLEIAAGNIAGGTADDLVGVWSSGLWVWYSGTGYWHKLNSALPNWIVAGDMANDGRADIVILDDADPNVIE